MTRYPIRLQLLLLLCVGCERQIQDVRLNEIQIIGSHNSYKQAIDPDLWQMIFEEDSSQARALQYEHLPLAEQLELGLRSLELDIFHDPLGGRYTQPLGLTELQENGKTTRLYDSNGDLAKPGLKVFHVQDLDFRSHQLLFKACLQTIKTWSDANRNHVPIVITVNAKDSPIEREGETIPLPFTKAALDSIDLEIRAVFDESRLITPDLIRGDYATLEQAVLEHGWPKIKAVQGRILLVLDETGQKFDDYVGTNNLKGRVMFVDAVEGHPCAAVRIINDPVKDGKYIQNLVAKGYLVRTRADADTEEARKNDLSRFKLAQQSGAQIISTDYYLPSRFFQSPYRVIFENQSYVRISDFEFRIADLGKN
jgi:hypothetical protein